MLNLLKKRCYFIKQIALGFMLFVICFPIHAQNNTSFERKQLFDYNWKFFLGDTTSARLKDFNDTAWRKLDLPHDWSIEGKLNPKNPMGGAGGYFPSGIGWYRKTFVTPKEWNSKRVSVYFEGVYMNSEVFINGKSLGVHPFGYTSFIYDLTPYLNYGKENVISVRVDNSKQVNSRWYSGSGIYRHVWLMVNNPVHLAQWGTVVTTPEVTSESATVQVKTLIKNESENPRKVTVNISVLDKNLKEAGKGTTEIELPAQSEKEVLQTINVINPLLWSYDSPDLYKAKIEVMNGRKVIDETNTNFGIRTIKYSAEDGFQLNGKNVIINGGCVHHDNGCLGAAAYDRAEERKVELLKAGGFNAVRTSHNPPSEAFLNACDRLGLLVMDESFDCWKVGKNEYDYSNYFNDWWQRDIEAMVKRDQNHPSIIMWSIGNEIPERKEPQAVETAKMLVGAIKKIDNTRPITSAVVGWGDDWGVFDSLFAEHDVAGYNYHLNSAPDDHKRVPSRVIIHTESYPRDAFANWKLVQENSYVIGDYVWTAIDYLGESGIGRYYYSGETPGQHWENDFFPWHGAYCGDVDVIGWRKPISHYRSMLYNDTEKLYMAVREPEPEPLEIKLTWWSVWPTWESWNWTGFEGKDILVEVYSKYPKVRLYLNDQLVGEQVTTIEQEFKATFAVPYVPGVLKAVGVEKGKEVESTNLQTAGEAASIKLSVDRQQIKANGQDLCYVTVEVTDEDGTIQPNADNLLEFTIEGEGTIVGVDNADLKDTDSYVGNSRKCWKGKALVVIKSTHKAGDIKLTVSSSGLDEVSTIITSEIE
jgi:beta-galactosidase